MKQKFFKIFGIIFGLVAIALVIIFAGQGNLFQGALFNLKPIYRECRIEGKNGTSTDTSDCENFFQRMTESQNQPKAFLVDGDYTIYTKYANPQTPDNIIPIRIKNNKLQCTYLESGYKPQISISDPNNPLGSQSISNGKEIQVGSNGIIAKINFLKDNQTYPYDDNICESALIGKILDSNKKPLGESKLDRNGFINSRPTVDELFIANVPYYNANQKDFDAGNIYLSFNFAPDYLFKFEIPCSNKVPVVEIPSKTVKTDFTFSIKGMSENYWNTCQDKIYWSIQNTADPGDQHQINLTTKDGKTFLLTLKDIPTLINDKKKPVYPISFLLKMHLRDRSDSNEVKTLGSTTINVTGYTPNSVTSEELTNFFSKASSTTQNKPKVRRTKTTQ